MPWRQTGNVSHQLLFKKNSEEITRKYLFPEATRLYETNHPESIAQFFSGKCFTAHLVCITCNFSFLVLLYTLR